MRISQCYDHVYLFKKPEEITTGDSLEEEITRDQEITEQ